MFLIWGFRQWGRGETRLASTGARRGPCQASALSRFGWQPLKISIAILNLSIAILIAYRPPERGVPWELVGEQNTVGKLSARSPFYLSARNHQMRIVSRWEEGKTCSLLQTSAKGTSKVLPALVAGESAHCELVGAKPWYA